MKEKISKLLVPILSALAAFVAVMAFPVVMGVEKIYAVMPVAVQNSMLVFYTFAQTMTLAQITAETGTVVTTYVPSLAIFIAAGAVFALAGYFVARLMRAGRT